MWLETKKASNFNAVVWVLGEVNGYAWSPWTSTGICSNRTAAKHQPWKSGWLATLPAGNMTTPSSRLSSRGC